MILIYSTKEVNTSLYTFCVFARNACKTSTLHTDCDEECLVTLLTEFLNRYIRTNVNAILELNTHRFDDVDLRLNNVLLQTIGRNTVQHHTAGTRLTLEYGYRVTIPTEEVSCSKTCRATTDNSNLVFISPHTAIMLLAKRYVTGFFLHIKRCDELLDLVDRQRLIDGTTGTCILTAAVTDMSTDCRKRIIFLDKCQRIGIPALRSKLQIALHGNMRRTRGFTGCGSGLMGLDTVLIPIILCPHMRSPWLLRRQRLLRVSHCCSVFFTQLLSQLQRSSRAMLHTASARHTVLCGHMGYIRRAGHVRGIEQLRGAQCIAYIHVTITDRKDLILSIDIRDLVHKSVILCFFQDLIYFFSGDIASAFIGLNDVVCHIAHSDTPAFRIIGAAFIVRQTGTTAGTGAGSILALVFAQPIGNML